MNTVAEALCSPRISKSLRPPGQRRADCYRAPQGNPPPHGQLHIKRIVRRHVVLPARVCRRERHPGQSNSRTRLIAELLDGHAALFRELCGLCGEILYRLRSRSNVSKVEARLSNWSAQHLNLAKVAGTHAQLFRQPQRAIASFERRSATIRHGVESHERHADRIGGHAVRSRDQQAGLDVAPPRSRGLRRPSWCGFHR